MSGSGWMASRASSRALGETDAERKYANCWTTVYSKLFDRVTKSKDEVNAVYTDAVQTPGGGGGCNADGQCQSDIDDQHCDAGWYPSDEIAGCDSLDDTDYYTDVICHIESYTDAPVS